MWRKIMRNHKHHILKQTRKLEEKFEELDILAESQDGTMVEEMKVIFKLDSMVKEFQTLRELKYLDIFDKIEGENNDIQ